MTRLAILSDIHGNLPALEAVVDDMRSFRPDQVIAAGDVVNWGPFSAQVMERVAAEGWSAIRGNNEFYLLDYNTPRQPPYWNEYSLLPWLYEQLRGRWHHIIAAWPDEVSLRFPDGPPLRVFHGIPGSPWIGITPITPEDEIATWLANVPETVVIGGHTHLQMDRRVGRWRLLNPGSVGVPLDGKPFIATYMLLDSVGDGWIPTFRAAAYDPEPLFAEFERQHFVKRFGVIARLVIDEFRTGRLQVHPYNLWRKSHHPSEPDSARLLTLFDRIDKWAYTPLEYHLNLDGAGHEPQGPSHR